MQRTRRVRSPVRGVRIIRRSGDPFAVQIVPLRSMTASDIDRVMQSLRNESGPIVTTAMPESAVRPFLERGFKEIDALHLLELGIDPSPHATASELRVQASPDVQLVPARPRHLDEVLAIDADSFEPFWKLDAQGIREARKATPSNRYRVAIDNGVRAYAICGLASKTSYLQRLATHRDARRKGLGSLLVADGVEWARRHGSHRMLVNTQVTNLGAIDAYKAMGFKLLADRLHVVAYNYDDHKHRDTNPRDPNHSDTRN